MLKPLGARALIEPLVTPRSTLLEVTDRAIPVVGRIRALGTVTCPHCGAVTQPDIQMGALVLVPPTSGQEVTGEAQSYWIVPIDELLAEWVEAV